MILARFKKSLCLSLVLTQSIMAAPLTCQDYYKDYLARSLFAPNDYPRGVVIVDHSSHFRGRYPEYRSRSSYERRKRQIALGERPEDRVERSKKESSKVENNESDDFFLLAFFSALLTTTLVEDYNVSQAQKMTMLLVDAENGSGPELDKFTQKLNKKRTEANLEQVSSASVAVLLDRGNKNQLFCPNGDLDSVNEVVDKVYLSL